MAKKTMPKGMKATKGSTKGTRSTFGDKKVNPFAKSKKGC